MAAPFVLQFIQKVRSGEGVGWFTQALSDAGTFGLSSISSVPAPVQAPGVYGQLPWQAGAKSPCVSAVVLLWLHFCLFWLLFHPYLLLPALRAVVALWRLVPLPPRCSLKGIHTIPRELGGRGALDPQDNGLLPLLQKKSPAVVWVVAVWYTDTAWGGSLGVLSGPPAGIALKWLKSPCLWILLLHLPSLRRLPL